jgi:hypothetical protein
MGERRGHPWAAIGIVVLTLSLAALMGGCAVLTAVFSPCFLQACGVGDWLPGVLFFSVPAVVCLVFGLVRAWGVGTGRTRDIWGHARERLPAASGPTWLVAEPGADLTEVFHGEVKVLAHLAAETMVTEVRHTVSRVLIAGPDGLSGWVDADRLRPPGEGGGGDG